VATRRLHRRTLIQNITQCSELRAHAAGPHFGDAPSKLGPQRVHLRVFSDDHDPTHPDHGTLARATAEPPFRRGSREPSRGHPAPVGRPRQGFHLRKCQVGGQGISVAHPRLPPLPALLGIRPEPRRPVSAWGRHSTSDALHWLRQTPARSRAGPRGRYGYPASSSADVSATAMPSVLAAVHRSRSPATMTVVSSRMRSAAARWTAS